MANLQNQNQQNPAQTDLENDMPPVKAKQTPASRPEIEDADEE